MKKGQIADASPPTNRSLHEQRAALALSVTALVLIAIAWSALAFRIARGRGSGSGDVAAGLAGLEDLSFLVLLGVCGLAAALIAYTARRRGLEVFVATLAFSASIATVMASALLVVLPLLI